MRQGADHVQPLTDQSKPVKPWSLLPGPGFSESVCWVPHHTIDAVIISFMCFNKNILKGSTGCVITPDESRLSSVTKLELDILNVFSLTPSPSQRPSFYTLLKQKCFRNYCIISSVKIVLLCLSISSECLIVSH